MAAIGIVVVTYRSETTIDGCLSSLRMASTDRSEIVVVDNASPDRSASRAESLGADIVLRNETNAGYGQANNQGVAMLTADTQFVVFANPDTVWAPGSLDALAATFVDETVGLASPLLVDSAGVVQAMAEDDLSLRRAVLGMMRLGQPVRPWAPSPDGDAALDVAWLHTAAAAMPMALVRAIGGFDERFFLFAEDADLCRRVRAAGRRVVVVPGVTVTHVGGASFDTTHSADETAALRTRALATYLEKYEGRAARRAFGAVGALVYGVGGRRGQAREALRAARR